jgi:hypothetical protein
MYDRLAHRFQYRASALESRLVSSNHEGERAGLRAADERRPLRDLLATDPVVAGRLSLAALDACFDDAAFLRHVPAVIGRLDAIQRGLDDRAAADRPVATGAAR